MSQQNKPIRVQLKRTKGYNMQQAANNGLPVVSVSRPSKWGNPFRIEDEKQLLIQEYSTPTFRVTNVATQVLQQRVVDKFRSMMLDLDSIPCDTKTRLRFRYMRDRIRDLEGKNLACYCDLNSPCHAQILLELANP